MEKTEAVGKLKKAGYQVQFDSSVVTIVLPGTANVSQELKKLRGVLTEIGYDASFGIKQAKDGDKSEERSEKLSASDTVKSEPEEFDVMEQETLERSSFQEMEIGEQFSLEDFGL